MRLCFVVESGTDVRLLNGLAERNDVVVIARGIPGGRVVSHPPHPSITVIAGPVSRVRFAARAVHHILTARPPFDHILVQGYGPAALATNLAARWSGRTVTMVVCSPAEGYYRCRRTNPQDGMPFQRPVLWAIALVARLNAHLGQQYVVLSRYLRDVVRGHGTRRPVHIIPVYGVDTTLFRLPDRSHAALRERMGLPPAGALIFFSSRVAPEKDASTLLAAVAILAAQGRDVRVLHRSGGHRAFVALAERIGVGAQVVATDAVPPDDALVESYQAADVCVQASLAEGLGFSPLEALACGVPVVAADVGGLRETIVEGRTGWTYPSGDARTLASVIAAVLDDPAEAARRAAAGRRMVQERFERRRTFEDLQRLLEGGATS